MIPTCTVKRIDQSLFKREANAEVVTGVLGFRIDADAAPCFFSFTLGQCDDFFESCDLKPAVELLWAFRKCLFGMNGFDF